MKKYILKKDQLNILLEKKKIETKMLNSIMSDIDKAKRNMNESSVTSDAITDIIKTHNKKNNLTPFIISELKKKGVKIK